MAVLMALLLVVVVVVDSSSTCSGGGIKAPPRAARLISWSMALRSCCVNHGGCLSRDVGVTVMTFDNADELHKVAAIDASKAKMVLRILTDDSHSVCK